MRQPGLDQTVSYNFRPIFVHPSKIFHRFREGFLTSYVISGSSSSFFLNISTAFDIIDHHHHHQFLMNFAGTALYR